MPARCPSSLEILGPSEDGGADGLEDEVQDFEDGDNGKSHAQAQDPTAVGYEPNNRYPAKTYSNYLIVICNFSESNMTLKITDFDPLG